MLDVLIIGAGPAGLYAADRLAAEGLSVTVADRMSSPARKFLMAGRGGLNLTHSEELDTFLSRYGEAEAFLAPMIRDFPPEAVRDWCHQLGEETFVGSSGRVFPRSMKASPLLRAWLRRLENNGVRLMTRHGFEGLSEDGTALIRPEAGLPIALPARAVLLALGGASWPKLGSNAAWVPYMEERSVRITPFQPANCGFQVAWSALMKERFAGTPLKRIALRLGGDPVLGEAVVSGQGLEGGAVYALSAQIRETINRQGSADLQIDLRPAMSVEDLVQKLTQPRGKKSMSTYLRKVLNLHPVEQALLREAGPIPQDPAALAAGIKAIPLRCEAPYAIDRAISSAGGISLEEVDDALMLRKLPGIFTAGEMLDWEAPTGGYLLQACFATAHRAAAGIAAYLKTGDGVEAR
ncbi:TIGR03862 family flavoprotein [Roseibium salinum]|uniref:TIGR03862 family flavoprotein n=1 Tax=Roseibium salinum TaxID=1604349 RepID=A0ABT3R4B8_9HYPH|nr:TIGR03862 family flavoprotein [Roseibium sp. DSM 29163]MCX2724068.1 TIGR03862 family flavoprotein [Roseibium sp. DSM 29163]